MFFYVGLLLSYRAVHASDVDSVINGGRQPPACNTHTHNTHTHDVACIEAEAEVYASWLLQLDSGIENRSGCPASPVHLDMFAAEFGWETMTAIPHAYWLHHTCGRKLASTQSCGDISAWYWFSPKHINHMDCSLRSGFSELDPPNEFHGIGKVAVMHGDPVFRWAPPPHKAYYSQKSSITWPRQHPESPSIMILNKFWSPNTYYAPLLHQVFLAIQESCPEAEVLYHRDFSLEIGFEEADVLVQSGIFQKSVPKLFPGESGNVTDWEWIKHYPFVQGTLDAFEQNKLKTNQYNEFLMGAMSHHNCFVTAQGGLQASSAWFGGQQVVLNKDDTMEIKYNFYEGGAPKFAGGRFTRVAEKDQDRYIDILKEQLLRDQCNACSLT